MHASWLIGEVDLDVEVPQWAAPLVIEVEDRPWIRAFKRARLVRDGNEPLFAPLVTPAHYGRNARAICTRYGSGVHHDAPSHSCNCGFHALTAHDDALDLYLTRRRQQDAVLLEVLLGGRIIVGGWVSSRSNGKHVRAELQVVTSYAVVANNVAGPTAARLFELPEVRPDEPTAAPPASDESSPTLDLPTRSTDAPGDARPVPAPRTTRGDPPRDRRARRNADIAAMATYLRPSQLPPPDIGVLARLPRSPRFPYGGRAVALDLSAPFDDVPTPDVPVGEVREPDRTRHQRRFMLSASSDESLRSEVMRLARDEEQHYTTGSLSTTSR